MPRELGPPRYDPASWLTTFYSSLCSRYYMPPRGHPTTLVLHLARLAVDVEAKS